MPLDVAEFALFDNFWRRIDAAIEHGEPPAPHPTRQSAAAPIRVRVFKPTGLSNESFVCIAIAIILSLLSWKYFESPVNFFGHRLSRNAVPSIAQGPVEAASAAAGLSDRL
jgi:peptidoglycan/LPS O-acetylase OafA/YrhL